MNLSSYIKKDGRALPVFLLVDVSGSMSGQKIGTVNTALAEMVSTFRGIKNPKGIIKLCIITFGNDQATVLKPLSEIEDNDVFQLSANGGTPMGKAFDTLDGMLNDKNVVSSRDYTPTVVLISDGMPTDFNANAWSSREDIIANWPSLARLLDVGSRSSKVVRLAMGIGDDADYNILNAFINNIEIPVIKANDNATIANFFKWVTMSVSTRSVSANPNEIDFEQFAESFDSDSIKF